LGILLGIVGAVVGGWLFNTFGMGVTGFNLYSLLVAFVGAAALLVVYTLCSVVLSSPVLGRSTNEARVLRTSSQGERKC